METRITCFGALPEQHAAETEQFARVTSELVSALCGVEPWAIILQDFRFSHVASGTIAGDADWNGQVDIMLVTEHRIVVYELKSFRVQVRYGTTTEKKWKVKRAVSDSCDYVRSYFLQASRQRTHMIRHLEASVRCAPCMPNTHYVVDGRVVFPDGSEFGGFFYHIPSDMQKTELDDSVLPHIGPENDRDFVRYAFSGRSDCSEAVRRIKLPRIEYDRLKGIFTDNDIHVRTEKWFRLLCESEIASDLATNGSDDMMLSEDCAILIARSSGLDQASTRIVT